MLKTPNKPMREIAETQQFGASLKRRNAMTSSARGLEDQRRILKCIKKVLFQWIRKTTLQHLTKS